ncbi:cell wall anchor protein [Pelomyxa schiedti]|nr:cell wall anchor protein [Pelomyxa schiedti]
MSLPRSEGSFVSTASLYVEGGDLGSSAGHDLFGNGHDKQTKRPLVLRVLLSISFIALLVSAYAAISPALTIWVISARGLTHLQKEAMNDAIEMTCINTESPMKANIENVETQMRSIVAYINAMIAERHDIVTDYVPIDVALDEVAPLYTLLNSYGGFFQVVGISAPDGSMIVSVEDTFGWPFQLIQFGFDENATAWFVPYVVEWYDVYWPGAFPVPPGMLLPHATLSDEQWNSLTPGCLLWSPIEIPDTVPDLTASLNAPILLPGSSNITALFSAGISAVNFLSIFGQEDQPGILCTFIQNQNSWIISSSCENISYADLTPQLTSNSSLWEIRDSTRFLSEALAKNSTGVVTFDQHNYSVAYLTIQTESGFTAITTVIADSSYFQKTYREVKSNLQKFIIVSLCIAVSLAGILSVFTLGGQLQVINRIKRISEVSLGEGTQPEEGKNQDESERKQKKRWHLGGDISKDSDIFCWGENELGQLGLGDYVSRSSPILMKVEFSKKIKPISCGAFRSVAVVCSNTLLSCGNNSSGQLGLGDWKTRNLLTVVEGLFGISILSMSCGVNHSVVVIESGDVYAWGANNLGQIGVGDCSNKTKLCAVVSSIIWGRPTSAIECGANHSFAILDSGDVLILGDNSQTQLTGKPPRTIFNTPHVSTTLSTTHFTRITCGESHTLLKDHQRFRIFWGTGFLELLFDSNGNVLR